MFVVSALALTAAPVTTTEGSTISEPGTAHPIESQLPAEYADALHADGLEALSYQETTEETEFAAATFASTTMAEPWTSDDHITRLERNYHGSTHNAGQQPVHDWLQDGDPPSCPTIAQVSWTTAGAQLYPAPSDRLAAEAYNDWHRQNIVIYSATEGDGGVIIVVPPGGSAETC